MRSKVKIDQEAMNFVLALGINEARFQEIRKALDDNIHQGWNAGKILEEAWNNKAYTNNETILMIFLFGRFTQWQDVQGHLAQVNMIMEGHDKRLRVLEQRVKDQEKAKGDSGSYIG